MCIYLFMCIIFVHTIHVYVYKCVRMYRTKINFVFIKSPNF